MHAFGKVMRKLIEEHDTNQASICQSTGLKKGNMSVLCAGGTQYPSIHTCKLIADYFNLTLDELWALVAAEEEQQ